MGWEKVKIESFLIHRDLRFKPNDPKIKGLKRIEKIDFSGNITLSEKKSNTDMILIKSGDLVISGINVSKGAMSVYQEDEDVTATIHYSSYSYDKEKIDVEFLKYFLKSPEFIQALKEQVPGGIKTEIKPKHILPLEVIIPKDVSEQRDIVNKLKLKNNKIQLINNYQINQLELLKNLRQQILQDAVQGKLVQQDPNDEPASVLLEKIKAEKEQLIKEGKIKKSKPLPEIKEDEIPFDIPENWVWCRWIDLLAHDNYSMKRGPFGSTLKKNIFVKSGVRVFEQYNPINDDPYWVRYFITKEKFKELEAFKAKSGDLLISCSGATLGRITEIPIDADEGIINQALLKLTLNTNLITNLYFKMLFRSLYMQKLIFGMAWGTAIPNMIGVNELKKLLIPLPPIEEQKRIIIKLNQLLEIHSKLTKTIEKNQKYSKDLLQIALKEALEPKE